jgi:hypothetical protein
MSVNPKVKALVDTGLGGFLDQCKNPSEAKRNLTGFLSLLAEVEDPADDMSSMKAAEVQHYRATRQADEAFYEKYKLVYIIGFPLLFLVSGFLN